MKHLFALALLAAALAAPPAQAGTLCTVVADARTGKYLLQQGDCAGRVTPASTFKIALSLMGFDAGILSDAHTPTLPFRDGYPDWGGADWHQPTDPTRWIKYSVVWYSQQITQALGKERFAAYTRDFDFGNADVAGDARHDGLTHAWIDSSLLISPLEQASFLRKVVNRQLPVSARAFEMTGQITEVARLPGGWDVHGKTGTGFPANADGSDDEAHGWGWFVGWAVQGRRTLVFARLIQDDGPRPPATGAGPRARAAFLRELPALARLPAH